MFDKPSPRPYDGDNLAFLHRQACIVDGLETAEGFPE